MDAEAISASLRRRRVDGSSDFRAAAAKRLPEATPSARRTARGTRARPWRRGGEGRASSRCCRHRNRLARTTAGAAQRASVGLRAPNDAADGRRRQSTIVEQRLSKNALPGERPGRIGSSRPPARGGGGCGRIIPERSSAAAARAGSHAATWTLAAPAGAASNRSFGDGATSKTDVQIGWLGCSQPLKQPPAPACGSTRACAWCPPATRPVHEVQHRSSPHA